MRDQWLRAGLWGAVPLATLAVAGMPLLGMKPMTWTILTWFVFLALRAVIDPVPFNRSHLRWTLFLALPFLLVLLDMFRAPALITGWKYAERSAPLLLFPLGFLLFSAPSTKRFREAMIDLFSMSSVILAVYANMRVVFTDVPPALVVEPGYVYNYRAVFGLVTGLHPPYAAYFFFLAALFQIVRYLDGGPHRVVRAIAAVVLFIAGISLASRMPLLAFAVAVVLVVLLRIPRKKAQRGCVGVVVALGITIALSPGIRERTSEIFRSRVIPASQTEVTSTNIRLPLAICSMETIAANWLLGTGQANAQATLDTCYQRYRIPLLLDGSYGTHNQVLHWWLCFGITGLLLFLAYFGVLLWYAWRQRNTAHLAFLVFLLMCMMTENLLSRQWGVVLFACFNALFIAGTLADRAAGQGRRA